MNPFKSLSHLRYKVMLITLSNVYDNLPTDELVLRDGKLFFIEVRAYVPTTEVALDLRKVWDSQGGLRAVRSKATAGRP